MTERKFPNGSIELMKFSDGSGKGYGGSVTVPRLIPETRIRLVENLDKQKDNSPDYWLEAPDFDAGTQESYWARAGAGWIKTAKTDGSKFLSINVDLNDVERDVNIAAFPADKDDQPKKWVEGEPVAVWRLVYNRPRRNAKPRVSAQSKKAKADLTF